jgi:cytochrome c-type biogenesis protein CcmH
LLGLMTVAALAIVLPPLIRRADASDTDRNALNLAIHRERLAALKAELHAQRLSRNEYELALTELEADLAEDLSAHRAVASARGRWAAALLVVLLPAFSLGLYWRLGGSSLVPELQRTAGSAGQAEGSLPAVEDLIAGLEARLAREPTNVEGRRLLGRSYLRLQRFDQAVAVLGQARQLAPDNLDISTDYAEALAFSRGGDFVGEPQALIETVLGARPEHPQARFLAGVAAFQGADYASAIQHWRQVLAKHRVGSEDAEFVQGFLDRAQALLAGRASAAEAAPAPEPATPSPAAAAQQAPAGGGIEVTVELDPALRQQVDPDDTVFVFARALQGPGMPLAALRKRVADLPFTVTLTDALALRPELKLSAFREVAVVARISKGSEPSERSGDLKGEVSPARVGAQGGVRVRIDRRVP